ncbi:MAG: bifunctional oligoribonuclease/PAP phosphatase NrnA [Actinomycetia bacterium]|nr:bifunctional oligoribonuclease/PAP phosphatase NrnA [Actinomycetes bacterium]
MTDLERVVATLDPARRVAVVTHKLPDGDTTGSALGLVHLLRRAGKDAVAVGPDPILPPYRFLPGAAEHRALATPTEAGPQDVVVTVDCGDPDRAFGLAGLRAMAPVVVNVDHHVTNRRWGDVNWIEPDRAAVGEMGVMLADALGVPLDRDAALCFYVSLATDTEGFRFGAQDPRILELAVRLVRLGLDPDALSRALFERQSLASLRLLGWALSHVRTLPSGRVAWVALSRATLRRLGAARWESEGIVNHIRALDGVRLAVFLREEGKGQVKISLRSRPPWEAAPVAQRLGGGGHRDSAGANLAADLDGALHQTLRAVEELYGEAVPWTALSTS